MSKKLSNENVLDDVSKDFEKLVESILKNGLDEATKIISDSETQSKIKNRKLNPNNQRNLILNLDKSLARLKWKVEIPISYFLKKI